MLTYGAQLTTWITNMMQKKILDEMFGHFCMTQKEKKFNLSRLLRRILPFDCGETERQKAERNIFQALLSPSMGVLTFFFVVCLLCSARVNQCLLPHCLWRPSLVMKSYRLCLKHKYRYAHTYSTYSTNTGKWVHGHVEGHPQKHTLCLHTSCILYLSHFCITASVSSFEPKAF